MQKLFLLLLFAFLIGSIRSEKENPLPIDVVHYAYDYYRLPRSVLPKHYRLQILTDLDDPQNLYFEGAVTILLNVIEETNNITLHIKNLTIDEKKISLESLKDGDDYNIVKTETNPKHDFYIMHSNSKLQPNEEYVLTIPFNAPLNENLHGYYKSSYFDPKSNKTRWLSITQFEPAAARNAFPCFDEPDMKAKFSVILGHSKEYQALSNMAIKDVTDMKERKGWVWTEFQESVPMSTYLVAYSINDFPYLPSETNLKNNVQFRTLARRNAIDQCEYASIIGPEVLRFYEEVFGINFPLAKIDQIAIPDFSAGAMENWGLVTYRETALLYAPNISSLSAKKRVAEVIAHELAHQWFGNLVTMKWWTDLWLNEGFATYVASLGVAHINPDWKSYDEESLDNTLNIFNLDALKSSHPISQPIQHTNQISEIFDSISYGKGSTVLRMMHLFLGDEAFRSGIKNYLNKYAYDNAEQDNLWESLTESAHRSKSIPNNFDIKRIMDSWTLQTGYPIITVTRDYENRRAVITQERYLTDSEASRTESSACWWVPLSYTTESENDFSTTEARDWLRCNQENQMIPKSITNMPSEKEWIIFNIKLSGLYKVNYDQKNWNMLIETLLSDHYELIHIINRAQLIDDALTLAWSGDQDYVLAMNLLEYLQREREYIPWKAALERLSDINIILKRTPDYELFKAFMRHILEPIYIHLNGLDITTKFDGKLDAYYILHKVLIASWSCRFNIHDCVAKSRSYFKEWRNTMDPDLYNPVPTDLRGVVYCTALRHGNDEDWLFLWARYKKSNVAGEKKTILNALGCTREHWVLARLLDWAFNESSGIRRQDSAFAFVSVVRGDTGYHMARDYLFANIKAIYNYYVPDTQEIGRLLPSLAGQMTSAKELANFVAFTEEYADLFIKNQQGVRRSLETVKLNVQWKERNYDIITQGLRSRNLNLKTF